MRRPDYSFIDALRDVSSGKLEFASKDIFLQRIDTCSKCEQMTKLTKQCKRCGCFVYSKAKLKKSNCPENKWMT